jgi:hypothetical protein
VINFKELNPNEKAARVIRLFGYLQIIAMCTVLISRGIQIFQRASAFSLVNILTLIVSMLVASGFIYFMFILSKALNEKKEWSRKAGIALGILMLFGFPIGTIAALFILYWLIKGWTS